MTIKTKFNVGDKVFTIIDGKIKQRFVHKLSALSEEKDVAVITYSLTEEVVAPSPHPGMAAQQILQFKEESVFATKAELVKSLDAE